MSPPVLYLQMENCFRDCKNIHIFGFCALLVKMAGVENIADHRCQKEKREGRKRGKERKERKEGKGKKKERKRIERKRE